MPPSFNLNARLYSTNCSRNDELSLGPGFLADAFILTSGKVSAIFQPQR